MAKFLAQVAKLHAVDKGPDVSAVEDQQPKCPRRRSCQREARENYVASFQRPYDAETPSL
ncbi:MAG: hypothetical protein QW680_14115 [Pyrobaculum sp.]